jgi:hypothetical protein
MARLSRRTITDGHGGIKRPQEPIQESDPVRRVNRKRAVRVTYTRIVSDVSPSCGSTVALVRLHVDGVIMNNQEGQTHTRRDPVGIAFTRFFGGAEDTVIPKGGIMIVVRCTEHRAIRYPCPKSAQAQLRFWASEQLVSC